MRKFFMFFVAVFCLMGCSEMALPTNLTYVEFGYSFAPAEGHPMTKAQSDIYDEFYAEIKNGNLVSDSYSLILTHSDGTIYTVSGKWGVPASVGVKSGIYQVTGVSTADGEYIQDKCSIKFNESVNTSDITDNCYTLAADYDCSLIVINNNNITKVSLTNGDEHSDFAKFNDYYYAFVHTELYDETNKDSAVVEFTYSDGTTATVSAKDIATESGTYYVYDETSTDPDNIGFKFTLPEMEDGNAVSDGISVAFTASAGEVKNLLSSYDCSTITSLTIDGHIDASDFRFIKWNCINLVNVDLSNVVIDAYSGSEGTNEGYQEAYAANEIPLGAFFYWESHYEGGQSVANETKFYDEGMPSLKSIKLPIGITAIRRNAFARAYNLTEINIPEGVKIVDYVSFRYCVSLKTIVLPSTTTELGLWAFTEMNALESVHCKAVTPPTTNSSFGGVDDVAGARGWVYTGSHKAEIDATLYVPKESVEAYKASDWSAYFKTIVGE